MADYMTHVDRYPKNYQEEMEYIRHQIMTRLKDYPNLLRVDFVDVSAHQIQVSGIHKGQTGYYYRSSFMKYDFSDAEQVIEDFVAGWIKGDTPEQIRGFQGFISAGNKWGWD